MNNAQKSNNVNLVTQYVSPKKERKRTIIYLLGTFEPSPYQTAPF